MRKTFIILISFALMAFMTNCGGSSGSSGSDGADSSIPVSEGEDNSTPVSDDANSIPVLDDANSIPVSDDVDDNTPISGGADNGASVSDDVDDGTPVSGDADNGASVSDDVDDGTPVSDDVDDGTPVSDDVDDGTPVSDDADNDSTQSEFDDIGDWLADMKDYYVTNGILFIQKAFGDGDLQLADYLLADEFTNSFTEFLRAEGFEGVTDQEVFLNFLTLTGGIGDVTVIDATADVDGKIAAFILEIASLLEGEAPTINTAIIGFDSYQISSYIELGAWNETSSAEEILSMYQTGLDNIITDQMSDGAGPDLPGLNVTVEDYYATNGALFIEKVLGGGDVQLADYLLADDFINSNTEFLMADGFEGVTEQDLFLNFLTITGGIDNVTVLDVAADTDNDVAAFVFEIPTLQEGGAPAINTAIIGFDSYQISSYIELGAWNETTSAEEIISMYQTGSDSTMTEFLNYAP